MKATLLRATRYGGQGRAKGETLEVPDDVANRWVNARHPLATAEALNLDDLKKPELIALAEQRGLDTEGTVAELKERLGG